MLPFYKINNKFSGQNPAQQNTSHLNFFTTVCKYFCFTDILLHLSVSSVVAFRVENLTFSSPPKFYQISTTVGSIKCLNRTALSAPPWSIDFHPSKSVAEINQNVEQAGVWKEFGKPRMKGEIRKTIEEEKQGKVRKEENGKNKNMSRMIRTFCTYEMTSYKATKSVIMDNLWE